MNTVNRNGTKLVGLTQERNGKIMHMMARVKVEVLEKMAEIRAQNPREWDNRDCELCQKAHKLMEKESSSNQEQEQ